MTSEGIFQFMRGNGTKSLTIVIKLGTSSIVDEKTHEPLLPILTLIVDTAVKLRKDGHRVVIVSSGAIGVGLRRMDVEKRPKHLAQLQALAAIGQCRLMSLWDSLFTHLRQPIAQILLTRNDIADRTRYFNAQNTFHALLEQGVIPIVNENDTLAVAEIKFGDNDTLSAITAAMIHADMLFLMTDVDCLYDKNPRTHPDAKPIEVVEDIAALQADVSSAGSSLGTGGMSTKIIAARLGTSAGVTTVITRSSNPGNVLHIVQYLQSIQRGNTPPSPDERAEGLTRSASALSLSASNGNGAPWPPYIPDSSLPTTLSGTALVGKAGLLPVGVVDVEGNFAQQEVVRLVTVKRRSTPGPDGKMWEGTPEEVGRALVNYAAAEIARIKGKQSVEIEKILGYADSEYVAHRQHVGFFGKGSRPVSPAHEIISAIME
ncbi:putative glutamate 5-kinase [Fusarium culmorum]|uniref:Putative glutamate 5-kinase n=1 Tax=Fusarium culmorum TaxID=5516 RepID=A0A2T4H242_FUSCU|nr:putative glutamate 5-kinase [Fusarium culmorum]